MGAVATRLSDLPDLLEWVARPAAHETSDDRQIVCDAANRCQALAGRSRPYGTDVLNELAALIEAFPVPRSPHARYLLQSVWLKTLNAALVGVCAGNSTSLEPGALKMVARCILACDRFRAGIRAETGPAWPQVVVEALHCMARRLHHPTTNLSRVAAEIGVSPWYLDRQLRRYAGTSFIPMLRALKIGKAMKLMQSTTMSVKEIAAATGYNYVTTFDRDFKRVHGITPTVWRRRAAA